MSSLDAAMSDPFGKEKRSEVMSRIRGRGNEATELVLAALFRANGITGWRRHVAIPGKPDFAFRAARIAIFVDGCFWHRCPRHTTSPKNNAEFWRRKLDGNVIRDRRINRELRKAGWRVVRIWEHDLPKRGDYWANRIKRFIAER